MMAFFIIFAIILFLLLMPLVLRVRFKDKLTAYAGIFIPFLRIYPLPNRKKRAKNKKEKEPGTGKFALREQWDLVYDLIRRFPSYFQRLISIRKLKFIVTVGNDDPGDLALDYGRFNALIGSLATIIDPIYPVEKWNVAVSADFERHETEYDGEFQCVTNLWRIIGVLISVLYRGIILKSDEKEILENGK